jgi:hypothetical protein
MTNCDSQTNPGLDVVRDELLELIDHLANAVTSLLWNIGFDDEDEMWATPEGELVQWATAVVKQYGSAR